MTGVTTIAVGSTDIPDRTTGRQTKDSAITADKERVTSMTTASMTIEVLDYV